MNDGKRSDKPFHIRGVNLWKQDRVDFHLLGIGKLFEEYRQEGRCPTYPL